MAKIKITNYLIYSICAVILAVVIAVVVWYFTMFTSYKKEGFTSGVVSLTGTTECPLSAQRKEDGKIHVEPQGRSFDTMADYVIWLSSLSTTGEICIPPYVKGPREVEVIQTSTSPVSVDAEYGANPNQVAKQNTSGNVFTKQVEGEQTYAKSPINKLDDYEYTRIFQNEASPRSELSHTTVNSLMVKNQFDWSKLPFNSETRRNKEDAFIAERIDNVFRDPKSGVFFKPMEGGQPPDNDALEIAEKSQLEEFKSEKPENLLHHTSDDVAEIVAKMYKSDPNWEPVVEQVGENEYRISELRPKPRKEYYETDEDEKTVERAKRDGLISAEVEVEGNTTDPYFDKQGVIDYSNDRFYEYKDFKQWTPGLERMFAPTLDTTNWI